jgi:Fe-S cluster assembly protein SufD
MKNLNSPSIDLIHFINSLPNELLKASMAGANDKWIAHKVKAINHYRQLPEADAKHKMWKKISAIKIARPQILTGIPKIEYCNDFSLTNEWAGIMEISEAKITTCLSEDLQSAGVIFKDIVSAADKDENLLNNTIQYSLENSTEKVDAITNGTADHGFFLSVPAGLCIEKPFKVDVVLSGTANYMALLLATVLGENSNAKVILEFKSDDTEYTPSLLPVTLTGKVGSNSELELIEIQDIGQTNIFFMNETIEIGENAIVNHFILDKGSQATRRVLSADLTQIGGKGTITGVYFPNNSQTFLYDTKQNHAASNTVSTLLFKGVLDNSSYSLWKGNIIVREGIRGADGYQLSNTLMLDPSSHAASIPGLEISTDDVKCSHGVTMSSVDKDQLFYLQTRGIGESDGKNLIVDGFIRSAISRIKSIKLQNYIKQKIGSEEPVFEIQ